jgi:hypothetical protein
MNSISHVQAGFYYKKEHLKWAQAPGETQLFYIKTTGFKKVKKLMFNGRFEYKNYQYDDLKYNNLLEFDNRNIYILGDTIGGHQKKEGFSMSGGVSIPIINNKLLFGINLDYEAFQGAKMLDPRNKNLMYDLKLTPGLIYKIRDLSLGLSGGLIKSNNEVKIGVMKEDKHDLFHFFGLGYFQIEKNITNYESLYEKQGNFTSFQLGINKNNWVLLNSLNYQKLSNRVMAGGSYRLLDGITDLYLYEYNCYAFIQNKKFYHQIFANISREEIKGTEVKQHAETFFNGQYYESKIITDRWVENKHINKDYNGNIEYRFSKAGLDRPLLYQIIVNIDARFYKANHYPISEYGYYESTNLSGYLSYQYWFHFNQLNFAPKIGIKYRKELNSEIDYKEIATKFFPEIPTLDFQYLTSDYTMCELDLTFLKSIKSNLIKEYFLNIKGSYVYIKDLSNNNYNFMINASLGFTF